MLTVSGLLRGYVVESTAKSWTAPYLYSDSSIGIPYFAAYEKVNGAPVPNRETPSKNVTLTQEQAIDLAKQYEKIPTLNSLAKLPFIGIVAGVSRMALAVIHSIGHGVAYLITKDKGHLYHAAKGGCEFLRGLIEALPIIGRIFANLYAPKAIHYSKYEMLDWDNNTSLGGDRTWWMIKMYDPNSPDNLDRWTNDWSGYPEHYPLYMKV